MKTPLQLVKALEWQLICFEWQATEATAEADNLNSSLVSLIRDTAVDYRLISGSTLAEVEFDPEEISFSAN